VLEFENSIKKVYTIMDWTNAQHITELTQHN